MNSKIAAHYDRLIELDNDPARDPQPLREYMDKWDGEAFFNRLCLDKTKSVLEIGVGTGRLAMRAAPGCGRFVGIDLSAKTIVRAQENLEGMENAALICGDFLEYDFEEGFDIIYSSLTFMHIREKSRAVSKIASLLNVGGRVVISVDRNRQDFIDAGFGRLEIYPDDPHRLAGYFHEAGLEMEAIEETEFAFILAAEKK